jgi:hypothetical protein
MAGYPGYGEQRRYSDPLGTEPVSSSWRRMPPDTGGSGSYGHPGKAEVDFVSSRTVTFKVGDHIFQAGPQTAVTTTGEQFYSGPQRRRAGGGAPEPETLAFTRRESSESPMRSVLLRMESGSLGNSAMDSLEL